MKHWFLIVYFLVSWKQFDCTANCSDNRIFFDGLTYPTVWNDKNTGSCSIRTVEQEQRFETEKEADAFIRSLNLTKFTEEMLDKPEKLKWSVKKKKVTITEKEIK